MIRVDLKFPKKEAKHCTFCRQTKYAADFYRCVTRNDGLSGVCRACNSESCRERLQRNKPRYRHQDRLNKLKRFYGLTEEVYNAMVEKQGNSCAICGSKAKGYLPVDHNHKTGKVRGMLCTQCNTGIGLLKDSPTIMQKAIRYLQITDGWTIRRIQL